MRQFGQLVEVVGHARQGAQVASFFFGEPRFYRRCSGGLAEPFARQIGDKTSYELRYRMMTLEMPDITAHIDSAYSLNSDKFHDLVIKREEENKLLYSIDRRREEIKKLKEVE